MASSSVARVEIGVDPALHALLKVGRRNSAADEDRIRRLRMLLVKAQEIIADLNVFEEDEPEEGETEKALSLDRLVGAVANAIEQDLNRDRYSRVPYEQLVHMSAVYPDVVILREGLCHWRVPYTVTQEKVVFVPRQEWVEVEPTWAEKKSVEDGVEASTLLGDEQKTAPEGVPAAEPTPDPDLSTVRSATVLDAVKAVGEGRLRHYVVKWGDANAPDLTSEFFTPQTQELDVIFKAMGKLPLLYHHGMDKQLKSAVVGVVDQMGADEVGMWAESQLDMSNRYANAILDLANKRKLGTSSGTLPGARQVKASGEITRWAMVEVSLTPTPAEPELAFTYPVEVVKAAYDELGLVLPELSLSEDKGAVEARHKAIEIERERLSLLHIAV